MRSIALVAACSLALAAPASAQKSTGTEVDLELVIAVDISYSMDMDELALQRDGYAAAITSKEVTDAIRNGPNGRIAVTYVEWAGAQQQSVVIPWQLIDGPQTAEAFAARLAETPLHRAYRTSISAALLFSAPLFENNGFEGSRRVIDVSGDGVNNQGPLVTAARDAVLARGIAINGLPVMIKPPSSLALDIANLDDYYRQCVIGGPGAFVVPAIGRESFKDAIRTKLILEISSLVPEAKVIPAQARPVSCSVGESMWGQRFNGYGGGGYDR